MNNFDEFKSSFLKENQKLKIILALVVLIFSVGTASILLQRKYFLYKGKDIFEERPLAEEVCRLGFLSLIEGEPNSHVVSKGIINLVKKEPFQLHLEKILRLTSSELGTCKIVLKAENRLMAFKIVLDSNENYPFFYKLNELVELAVDKETL